MNAPPPCLGCLGGEAEEISESDGAPRHGEHQPDSRAPAFRRFHDETLPRPTGWSRVYAVSQQRRKGYPGECGRARPRLLIRLEFRRPMEDTRSAEQRFHAPCSGAILGVNMRFVVYAAGAVGGVLGGHLALSKHDVLLVCRDEHARAIGEAEGLRMKSGTGEYLASGPGDGSALGVRTSTRTPACSSPRSPTTPNDASRTLAKCAPRGCSRRELPERGGERGHHRASGSRTSSAACAG